MEHKKTTTHDVKNPGAGLGQAHTYDRVKPDKGIPTLPSGFDVYDLRRVFVLSFPQLDPLT